MKKNQKISLILKKNITFAFADWQIAFIERTFSSALANFRIVPFDWLSPTPISKLKLSHKNIVKEKIDKLDKQIMEIISGNARIPFKDVAAACGVSRAAIHQRVQRLIDMNVIIGSGYNVNPKSLGYNTCTYVGIRLEKGSMYKRVVDELKHIPEIVECHYTTGPYTMLIKLYARDNEQLMELLNTKIQGIQGVDSTETLISLDQSIKKEVPISTAEEEN